MEIFSYPEGLDLLTRLIHIIAGITWIGLLYYFNFVQAPFFAETEAGVKSAATRQLVPRALAWFRYSALVTFLAGLALLLIRLDVFGSDVVFASPYGFAVLTGGILGTLMFINVWAVIWPNQKIVIGSAGAVAEGGSPDPRADGATRRALLASRTNVVLSIPMLFFMATSGHGGFLFRESTSGERLAYWLIFAGLVALIEGNALIGRTGPAKWPLETIGRVISKGVVLAVLLYVILALFAGA